jgi:two-component system, OmpR family, response regulator RegX3
MSARILIVEENDDIREALSSNLKPAGYIVTEARDGGAGLQLVRPTRPDLILLGVMLPTMTGLDFSRALRRTGRVPIILVAASDSEVDMITELELAADDFLTKPFSSRELLARVNAVLRRKPPEVSESETPEREQFGNFVIDRPGLRVLVDGVDVRLSAREFELLSYLLANAGRVLTRRVLHREVWGEAFAPHGKTLPVHVRWLREKFAGRVPFEIVTVHGVGYRLDRLPVPSEPVSAGNAVAS